MDKFAEWMLVNMFGKYYAEIGTWKCLMEKGMSCICVSGEVLNHAISAMLMFYSMPNMEYSVKFIEVEDELCPILVRVTENNEEILYVAIKKGEECDYNAEVTGFPKCDKNVNDDKLYIKYNKDKIVSTLKKCHLRSCKTDAQKYEKLLVKLEARLINSCITMDQRGSNYGLLKNSMMLHAVRRMRIFNNNCMKRALLAIRFFLSAKGTFELLSNYVDNTELNNQQKKVVKDFVKKYKMFIRDLEHIKYSNGKSKILVSDFAEAFYKTWEIDISYMLYECIEKNGNMDTFSEMLTVCQNENVEDDQKEIIRKIEERVEQ